MRCAIICFTLTGLGTAETIKSALEADGAEVNLAVKSKYLSGSISQSTGAWAGEQFETQDAILFVGATGIAVRSIAPYVASKRSDPAVLVVDECGKYVISLLSGHLGGANELTDRIAAILHAIPVITTATDLHGRFAVDVFAKKNQCAIFHMKAAKEASAALLAGEKIGFYSEVLLDGKDGKNDRPDTSGELPDPSDMLPDMPDMLPEGLIWCDAQGYPLKKDPKHPTDWKPEIGVAVTISKTVQPFASTVVLVPKLLVLGLGCRRGKDAEGIHRAAEQALERGAFYKEAIAEIASIDLKKEEVGILSLAEEWQIPFLTYTEEELKAVPGEFTPSAFVKTITGVDNVCERSAVLASGRGTLLQKKVGADGVTTAIARKKGGLKF